MKLLKNLLFVLLIVALIGLTFLVFHSLGDDFKDTVFEYGFMMDTF